MSTKKAEKAFQFAVWTPSEPAKQIFLVGGASEPIAERRLRKEIILTAKVEFQREANKEDIDRTNLMADGVVRLR